MINDFEVNWVDFESVNQIGKINNYGKSLFTIVFVHGDIKILPDFSKICNSQLLIFYSRKEMKLIEKESLSRQYQARINESSIWKIIR